MRKIYCSESDFQLLKNFDSSVSRKIETTRKTDEFGTIVMRVDLEALKNVAGMLKRLIEVSE